MRHSDIYNDIKTLYDHKIDLDEYRITKTKTSFYDAFSVIIDNSNYIFGDIDYQFKYSEQKHYSNKESMNNFFNYLKIKIRKDKINKLLKNEYDSL